MGLVEEDEPQTCRFGRIMGYPKNTEVHKQKETGTQSYGRVYLWQEKYAIHFILYKTLT